MIGKAIAPARWKMLPEFPALRDCQNWFDRQFHFNWQDRYCRQSL